jgi:hypothetical protein
MHPALKVVCARLSGIRDDAEWLFARDDAFRELCEEYEACTAASDRLTQGGPESLRNEYKTLLLRLEGEMLRYVASHQRPGAKRT